MRRLVILMCMTILSVCAFAGGSVKVNKGKASFLKTDAKVSIVFDWSEAKYDNKEALKDHLKDYDKMVKLGETAFSEGFSKKAKTVSIATEDNGSYRIDVKVTNLDMFFSAMSIVPGYKFKIWATVTVTNLTTNEVECVAVADEIKGGRDFSIDDSYKKCLTLLGEDVATMK